MERLLLVGPAGDERGAGVLQADEAGVHVRRAHLRVLLVPDELLHERRAAPAELARPIDTGPARVEHAALPGHVVLAPPADVGDLGTLLVWNVRFEPPACGGTERFLGSAESELHTRSQYDETRPRKGAQGRRRNLTAACAC